jgi:D-alanyl-D-alanine carboxypeptidase
VPKGVLGLLAALACGVSACSTPAARGAEQAAVAHSAPVVRFSTDELSLVPGSRARAAASPPTTTTTSPPTTAATTTTITATTTAASTTSPPGDGSGSTGEAGSDVISDDAAPDREPPADPPAARAESGPADPERYEAYANSPTFDAEPLVPLELAGTADDTGRPSSQSWTAFDEALAGALLGAGNTAASVAVSIGGEVVHRAAFGTRTPGVLDPVEVQDRFRVASISKVITAVTLLQLVEDGVVGLDEPIGLRVAEHVGLADPSPGAAGLTVRQLLTHTSGYGKYYSTYFGNGASDCRHAAAIGLRDGGGGGGYTYSNMNFCVAGMLIESLTGTSYEAAAYQHLLTPLGISGMRLPPTIDPGPDEVQHVTTPGRNYMETLGAAGAWIASPTDLVTIMNALDPTTPGWKPLEDETMLQMFTPVYGQLGQRGYGMGMILYGDGRYGHTGTIESTRAMLLNRGDGVIWAVTVAGSQPWETSWLEGIVNEAFAAGGFVAG